MTRRIGIVVFDGVTLLDVSGPAEVFRLAGASSRHYETTLVSAAGGAVRSSSGIVLAETVAAAELGPVDTLIIAGGDNLADAQPDPALLDAVSAIVADSARVASVCTGSFVLAELGLLDGRRATTHWRHAEKLAHRYPRVAVEPDMIHVQDGHYLTSAGITAGIDLALALVEADLGAEQAREVARELVMFMQRPGGQSQYSTALRRPAAESEPLRKVMDAVSADPSGEHTVSSMAALVDMSVRHLNRLFRSETGTTPGRWLEESRLDMAQALLLDGYPITRVAQLAGFGSDETMRRAFARHLDTTPTAFRERFSTTRPPHEEGRRQ